ncbi:hypothetical protein OIO90_005275 [Microbotryomycetes sp. JL221]|nr:hypothetical protein OIO90_005275 [Microbotryomycetes sp. JL221]
MTTNVAADLEERLKAEFCPPLDSSLVSALLLDFPEPTPADEDQLRTTLQSLASAADGEDELQNASIANGQETNDVDLASPTSDEPIATVHSKRAWKQVNDTKPETSSPSSAPESSAVSDLGDKLEVWDLGGADSRQRRSHDGTAFWNASVASTTSTEDSLDRAAASMTSPHDDDPTIPNDPLALLASLFPSIGLDKLELQLAKADQDLDKCVEELLSVDLLHQLEEEEKSEQEKLINASAAKSAPVDKQAKRRAKQAFKAANKISLTAPQYDSSGPPSPAFSSAFPASQTALSLATPDTNRWASISSEADQLSTLLHVPASRITSTYHACSCSMAGTLSTLLNQLVAARPFEDLAGALELDQQLSAILPSISTNQRRLLLAVTEGDLSDSMDLQRKIEEVEASEGKLTWSELVSSERFNDDPSSAIFTPAIRAKKQAGIGANGINDKLAHVDSEVATYTARECAAFEAEYSQKREEAIRSAMRHFQRGGTAQRGAAYYWAEQGRELDAKRRIWSERHARALVRERQIEKGSYAGSSVNGSQCGGAQNCETVDLHGLSLHHAQLVVKDALNVWYSNLRTKGMQPGQRPLKIVTGVGRHSAGQTPILMPGIIKLLDREGWKWKWDGVGETGKGAVAVVGVIQHT